MLECVRFGFDVLKRLLVNETSAHYLVIIATKLLRITASKPMNFAECWIHVDVDVLQPKSYATSMQIP
jgi:hypothetical protein